TLVDEEDVPRPQIAMHVSEAVRLREGLGDLPKDVDRALDRQHLFALDDLGERLTLEVLHREEQPVIVGPSEVEHLQDVIVVELRYRRRLATEPLERRVVRRKLRMQNLDRDALAKRRVLAAIDRPRPPLPHFLHEEVAISDH